MNKIINLGILAHVDAGKTTLTEGLLVHSGVKRQRGSVDKGTTTTDSMALERQRGMTIRAATVSFPWKGVKINLIDTPGHMDFIAEVERTLSVLDGVVLVVSAREGVQPQTRVLFQKLRQMRMPTLFFINKIDRQGVDLAGVVRQMRETLSPHLVVMQAAQGAGSRDCRVEALSLREGPLFEELVSRSDRLLADYLAGKRVPVQALIRLVRRRTQDARMYPTYLGSALGDVGVEPLLSAIPQWFGGRGDPSAPLSAYVYKVEFTQGRKRAYLRLFSGSLAVRQRVPVTGQEQPVQVKALLALGQGALSAAQELAAGDVGVVPDAPELRCGDFLGAVTRRRGASDWAQPLLQLSLTPDVPGERPRLLDALSQLTQEDPLLSVEPDAATGEIRVRLFGRLQLEILTGLLLERYGLTVRCSPLKTLFKEQPLQPACARIALGAPGNLLRAGIELAVEPLAPGSGEHYETRVSYGSLEKSFQNAVAEGVQRGLAEGVNCPIADVRVTFTGSEYDSVTSTPADFRRLAPLVLHRALQAAGLRRLEPWQRFQLFAPIGLNKKLVSALTALRASLEEIEFTQSEVHLSGLVPLDTSKDFASELGILTQGKGVFLSQFAKYLALPDGPERNQ